MEPLKPILLAAVAAVVLVGCLGEDPDGQGPGTGGRAATGGASASGGTPGTGGASSSGGAPGTGGVSASGGAPGTGGAINGGSGGSNGSGGRSASGGSTVVGGTSGAAGGANGGNGGNVGSTGGGGGRGGATGSGGIGGMSGMSGGYQPCQSNPCKILPLGDSITFGVGDEPNGGYRGPLFAAAVAAGQKITFTGSLSNGPTTVSGQTFPRRNEGHNGWGIARVTPFSGNSAGIATLIPNPAFGANSGGTPEIILLHIGTNDATNFTAAQMQSDLKTLLDKIFAGAPNALVVLARIIPIGYDVNNAVVRTYNQALPGIVQESAAAGKHIVLVDMNTGFAGFVSDNLHPNTSGYKLMADRWHAAIGPLLPK
jgi:lysophospholipase L1-like esterase